MEERRGRRLALALLFCTASGGAAAACPLLPGEHKLDYRLVEARRAVEIRRHGVPESAPALCVLALDCRVAPATVRHVAYRLRPGSILLGDITALEVHFLDGQVQTCSVTDIKVPQ